jgi:hypothetical protein
MSKLNELEKWLLGQYSFTIKCDYEQGKKHGFDICLDKARSLLAEEASQKPPLTENPFNTETLAGQLRAGRDWLNSQGYTLAETWIVSMSGRTFSEKPTKCEYINNRPECRRRCPSLCPANTDNDCNVGEKPTAPASLVSFRDKVKSIFEDIMLSEDTEYDDAESVAVAIGELLQDTPTESIAEEPLEELAKRKGNYSFNVGYDDRGGYYSQCFEPGFCDEEPTFHCDSQPTYAAAEAKARKYLESLPDKGGK